MNESPLSKVPSQPVEPMFDVGEWREQSKALAQTLSFLIDRMYLDASNSALKRHLRFVPQPDEGLPISWLRVETVGGTEALNGFDPISVMRIALETCHRPGESRLYFLVRSSGEQAEVFLGLRAVGESTVSEELSESARSFLESAWPATRLTRVSDPVGLQRSIAEQLSRQGGQVVMTGVPRPQNREGNALCGIECLMEGLVGRPFAFLVVADPVVPAQHQEMLGRIRDLVGALQTLQEFSLTHSSTFGTSTTRTSGTTEQKTDSHQIGTSETSKKHARIHKLLDFITVGSAALAPLAPPMAAVAALTYLVGEVLPRDLTDGRSESWTASTARGTSSSVAEGTSTSRGTSVAHKYVDAHLGAISNALKGLLERIEGRKMWEVGSYLLAESTEDASDAASQLAALLNGPRHKGEEVVRFRSLKPYRQSHFAEGIERGQRLRFELAASEHGDPVHHPLGSAFGGLSTPLNSDELALMCALPRREVPGIRVRPFANFGLNTIKPAGPSIELGAVLRGDQPTLAKAQVGIESLTKNVLVTGIVGSGKTNTVMHVLGRLREQKIPFLVIEPAKSEYLDWARRLNASLPADSSERIAIYVPGSGSMQPGDMRLRLNPFFVQEPRFLTMHIERLKTLLIGSLPMQEAMPMLLESVLYACYRHNGWFSQGDTLGARRFPTLSGALVAKAHGPRKHPDIAHADTLLGAVVADKGYEDRVTANFIAALRSRLEFLAEKGSWKGEVFDCAESTSAADLFERPAIVNLSNLHADRPFAAGLLLGYLHEYRRAEHDRVTSAGLRHLAVLEEAHCLLEPSRHVGSEAMDPKGMLSAMCSEMLSEMRAWGQGFMLVDQYPTRLVQDAVKNTSLKIVHRLPARDDQEAMAAAMSLSPSQARIIPFLRTGQAIMVGDEDDVPLRIQVPRARET